MTEETKKVNFFKSALKSVKDLDKYEDFALELPKDAFKYLFKLVLIFTIIITLFNSYKMVESLNDIYESLKEKLPDFSYAEGVLNVNSKEAIVFEEYKDSIGKVIIDTSEEQLNKYEEEIKNSSIGILFLKDKLIITSNSTNGQVMYKYSELASKYEINEFTKQDVINYIDGINIVSIYSSIYFAIFIYLFMAYFVAIFIDVLVLAVLAYLVSRISRIRLKFAPSFSIAAHAITLPVILNLIYIIVNLLTGFNIKYFQFMYSTISYIYIVVAILMIKTDFINRQMELMKLAQEQEKVKEELNKQKEEENKKKEEEKETKNKDKKEKEDKKSKKEDDGQLEEGVNPSVIEEKH